jgi:hypothetical protein
MKRRLGALTIAAAILALVLETASVPHAHLGVSAGLWNQEHDLATLAAFGTGVLLPEPAVAPPLVLVASAVPARPAGVPRTAPRPHADPRAPPSAA